MREHAARLPPLAAVSRITGEHVHARIDARKIEPGPAGVPAQAQSEPRQARVLEAESLRRIAEIGWEALLAAWANSLLSAESNGIQARHQIRAITQAATQITDKS